MLNGLPTPDGAAVAAQVAATREQVRPTALTPDAQPANPPVLAGADDAELAASAAAAPKESRLILEMFADIDATRSVLHVQESIRGEHRAGLITREQAHKNLEATEPLLTKARGRAMDTDRQIDKMIKDEDPNKKATGHDLKIALLQMNLASTDENIRVFEEDAKKPGADSDLKLAVIALRKARAETANKIKKYQEDRELIVGKDGQKIENKVEQLAAALSGGTLTEEQKKNPLSWMVEKIGESMATPEGLTGLGEELVKSKILSKEDADKFVEEATDALKDRSHIPDKALKMGGGLLGLLMLLGYFASKTDKGGGQQH